MYIEMISARLHVSLASHLHRSFDHDSWRPRYFFGKKVPARRYGAGANFFVWAPLRGLWRHRSFWCEGEAQPGYTILEERIQCDASSRLARPLNPRVGNGLDAVLRRRQPAPSCKRLPFKLRPTFTFLKPFIWRLLEVRPVRSSNGNERAQSSEVRLLFCGQSLHGSRGCLWSSATELSAWN